MLKRSTSTLLFVPALVLAILAFSAAPAFAEGEAPWWGVSATAVPSELVPGGGYAKIVVTASNLGDGEAIGSGTPIVLSDKLPAGVIPVGIGGSVGLFGTYGVGECLAEAVSCTFTQSILPYVSLEMVVTVRVEASVVSGVVNEAVAEGGGAPRARFTHPLTLGAGGTPFGIQSFEQVPEGVEGVVDTQAGSHPFQLTTLLNLNEDVKSQGESEGLTGPAGGLAKDLHFSLPAGLVGNPTAIPQCTSGEFSTRVLGGGNLCPADTAIGVAVTTLTFPRLSLLPVTVPVPVFNMVPQVGEPARFAFDVFENPVILNTAVRTGGDYGVVVSVENITQDADFIGSSVTLWGVPGDPGHNSSRGWECLQNGFFGTGAPCEPLRETGAPPPFLTLPASCMTPWSPTVSADSWTEPAVQSQGEYALHDAFGQPLGLSGCNQLTFEPSISVAADGQAGSSPTGLTTTIHVPQTAGLNPEGDAQATVKDTTVTLPEGVALNPSAADGLSACGESEVGLEDAAEVTCPESSKVGTVETHTPLLPNPLTGAAYLATQDQNPFGSLIALYVVARDPVSGVLIKVAGQVTPNPVTGQLVATFNETPDLPFEDFSLNFFGGSRAPLNTPPSCGSYLPRK